jgi:hypothetical protein
VPEDSVKDERQSEGRRKLTPSGALLLGAALAASGALVALAIPRPVAPTETPGLHLSDARAAEARRLDRARAARAPEGLMAEQLLDAYYRHGNAERFGTTQRTYQHDRRVIARSVALLRQEHGDDALLDLQASVVERLDDALAGRMDEPERAAFLGGFEEMMGTYGLVDDGEWRAPDIAVRALFKARFNATLRRPLTEGLHAIELEAYWGWLALEAHDAPIDRRLEALDAYDEATGHAHPEARGVLLFQAGEFLPAAEQFELAYAETGSVRLRNHAMAAMAEAEVSL